MSVNDNDKVGVLPQAKALAEMGFHIYATRGTAQFLNAQRRRRRDGLQGQRGSAQRRGPDQEPARSTSSSTRRSARESFYDDGAIRKSATLHGVLVVTTLTAAAATVQGIAALRSNAIEVTSLQEIHAERKHGAPAASELP